MDAVLKLAIAVALALPTLASAMNLRELAGCKPGSDDPVVTREGLFITHTACDHLLFEIPDSVYGKDMLANTEFAAVSGGTNLIAPGTLVDNRVVRWVRRGNKVNLEVVRYEIAAQQEGGAACLRCPQVVTLDQSADATMIEVAVGGVIGLFVSLMVLPARAHDFVLEAATQMLALMARFLPELFAGFTGSLDREALSQMQTRIGEDWARLDKLAGEAVHERITRLGAEPDQRPLLSTMVRLRHDIIMIGRAALSPLPGAFLPRLRPHVTRISEACADYLRASGVALSGRQAAPSLDAVESALDGYAAQFAALRRQGLTRELPDDAVERIFAFGFALDQLQLHLRDLARCVAEFAPADSAAVASAAATSGGVPH